MQTFKQGKSFYWNIFWFDSKKTSKSFAQV